MAISAVKERQTRLRWPAVDFSAQRSRIIPEPASTIRHRAIDNRSLFGKIKEGVLSYKQWTEIFKKNPSDPLTSRLVAHTTEENPADVSPAENLLVNDLVGYRVFTQILKEGLQLGDGLTVERYLGGGASKQAFKLKAEESDLPPRVMLLGSEEMMAGEKRAYCRIGEQLVSFDFLESTLGKHFNEQGYSPAPAFVREGIFHLLAYDSKTSRFESVLRTPFFETLFEEGNVLDKVIASRKNKNDFAFAGAILISMLKAREAIGRTHGDLKPKNIYVCFLPGRNYQCMLLDLQEYAYTPEYVAPEQIIGKTHDLSDLYAFGTIFYEMMTGEVPFSFKYSPEGIRERLISLWKEKTDRGKLRLPDPPEKYLITDKSLWEGVQEILGVMTTSDPEERFIIPGSRDVAQTFRMYRKVLEGLVVKYLGQDGGGSSISIRAGII